MKDAVVSIYLENSVEPIPPVYIKSFSVFAGMNQLYPTATIILDDPEGRFLSTLLLEPGDHLTIGFAEGIPGNASAGGYNPTLFCPFIILSMSNDGVYNSDNEDTKLGSLGGDCIIQCIHPWAIQTDWSNHAYTGKSSEIIRKIVATNNRGFTFTKITIDPTDDSGEIIRYKVGDSEARFIHRKILPYTTIDKQAAYSFVDELGGFNLRSFLRMYNQEPKAVVLPPLTDLATNLYDPKSKLEPLSIFDGMWTIGHEFLEQLGNMKKKIYLEDSNNQLNFVAKLPYTPSIPGYILVKKEFIDNIDATDSAVYPFRNFEDAVRLNVNNNSIMNEFFRMSVVVNFSPDLAIVGQTLQVNLAGYETTELHWMSGKWLVTGTEHYVKDSRYYTKYFLCRPALNNLPTSVNPESLYKV